MAVGSRIPLKRGTSQQRMAERKSNIQSFEDQQQQQRARPSLLTQTLSLLRERKNHRPQESHDNTATEAVPTLKGGDLIVRNTKYVRRKPPKTAQLLARLVSSQNSGYQLNQGIQKRARQKQQDSPSLNPDPLALSSVTQKQPHTLRYPPHQRIAGRGTCSYYICR